MIGPTTVITDERRARRRDFQIVLRAAHSVHDIGQLGQAPVTGVPAPAAADIEAHWQRLISRKIRTRRVRSQ